MDFYEFYGNSEGTAICLGDFDGMHKGHRRVFAEAEKMGEWGVLLFTHNSKDEKELLTLSEKLDLIEKLGAKYAVAADFKAELKNKSCEEFVEILKSFKVKAAVVGYDYRFGKGAMGNAKLLCELCAQKGIRVGIANAVEDGGEPIKSTRIRALVEKGHIAEANRLLGSPYIISGIVEKGLGKGRKLGFPTANIGVLKHKLLPRDGVYKGIIDGKDAVINIGKNPTFNAEKRTVEVHIIGEDKDLYGESVTVQITGRIRSEIKFSKEEDLIYRIKRDIDSIKGEK